MLCKRSLGIAQQFSVHQAKSEALVEVMLQERLSFWGIDWSYWKVKHCEFLLLFYVVYLTRVRWPWSEVGSDFRARRMGWHCHCFWRWTYLWGSWQLRFCYFQHCLYTDLGRLRFNKYDFSCDRQVNWCFTMSNFISNLSLGGQSCTWFSSEHKKRIER